ncbi:MAG: hypothetical protein VKP62_14165 [Candidatus Sericytochromatia bacterium]|nr:hypothetical protein [Candidatus Sericytochromatia bacterium]
MQTKFLKLLTAGLLATALTGCFRVSYDLDGMSAMQPGEAVRTFRTELKSTHLLLGLVNPNEKLVREAIAREVKQAGGKRAQHVRLTREIDLVDGLITSLTFGLYSPWSLVIEGDIVR